MEIPYRKIAIYVLTFVAYAYTGMGSSMLRNLKDAVLSAESVFGDMFKNVITVAEKFRSLHEVFDAAVEEECIFNCPEGILILLLNFTDTIANCLLYILKFNFQDLDQFAIETTSHHQMVVVLSALKLPQNTCHLKK